MAGTNSSPIKGTYFLSETVLSTANMCSWNLSFNFLYFLLVWFKVPWSFTWIPGGQLSNYKYGSKSLYEGISCRVLPVRKKSDLHFLFQRSIALSVWHAYAVFCQVLTGKTTIFKRVLHHIYNKAYFQQPRVSSF